MKNLLLLILTIVLVNACATIPQNKTDFEAYAKDKEKFKHESINLKGDRKRSEAIIREFAKKCIPAKFEITTPGGGYRGLPSSHVISFRSEVVSNPDVTSWYLQKDLGGMVDIPYGGMYFIWLKVNKTNQATMYWMDRYGFRGPEILEPLKEWFYTEKRNCPDLKADRDLAP